MIDKYPLVSITNDLFAPISNEVRRNCKVMWDEVARAKLRNIKTRRSGYYPSW